MSLIWLALKAGIEPTPERTVFFTTSGEVPLMSGPTPRPPLGWQALQFCVNTVCPAAICAADGVGPAALAAGVAAAGAAGVATAGFGVAGAAGLVGVAVGTPAGVASAGALGVATAGGLAAGVGVGVAAGAQATATNTKISPIARTANLIFEFITYLLP